MLLAADNDLVQAFATDGPNQALGETVLPWGPRRTIEARSPDQLTRFALLLNGMRFSVHTAHVKERQRWCEAPKYRSTEAHRKGHRAAARIKAGTRCQNGIAEVGGYF